MKNDFQSLPSLSVIIPVFNEVDYIEDLVHNLEEQSYPNDRIEIVFVDGFSCDGTYEKLLNLSKETELKIKVIRNEKRITPVSMNLGIIEASNEYIARLDAHSRYNPDYLLVGVTELLSDDSLVSVGGFWYPDYEGKSICGRQVAKTFFSPLLSGWSRYRVNSFTKEKRGLVDTVPYGVFRRDQLIEIGLYNESLIRGQDIDLYYRLKKRFRGSILITPDMKVFYKLKANDCGSLASRHFKQGLWLFRRDHGIRPRHWLPLFAFLITVILGFVSIKAVLLLSLFYVSLVSLILLFEVRESVDLLLLPYSLLLVFSSHASYVAGLCASSVLLGMNKLGSKRIAKSEKGVG